jgi:hypothetical protein
MQLGTARNSSGTCAQHFADLTTTTLAWPASPNTPAAREGRLRGTDDSYEDFNVWRTGLVKLDAVG